MLSVMRMLVTFYRILIRTSLKLCTVLQAVDGQTSSAFSAAQEEVADHAMVHILLRSRVLPIFASNTRKVSTIVF